MSLFDFFKCKVIYIVSANTFDAVVDWGFYATVKKRFHLSDTEYNPNLSVEDIAKLKEAKKRLSDLVLGKEVVVRVHKTNVMEKWVAEVFIPFIGIKDGEKYLEKTPAGEFVSVNAYLIGQGFLKN